MDGCAPKGIITDQARAMKNTIEIVFPNTRHRWCLWHIMKKLPEKLGRYTEHETISSSMKRVVYDTQSPAEFENYWKKIVDKYILQHCEWLNELYDERKRSVPHYVKSSLWTGMSNTQRSKSMNAFFDGYVHSKISLKQFVKHCENALRNKVEKETQADADSFSKQIPTITQYMLEGQIQEVYTLSKFKEFQAKLIGKIYCEIKNYQEGEGMIEYVIREFVLLDGRKILKFFNISFHEENCEVNCSCQLFVFKGIFCRHALTIFIKHDVCLLPNKYILRRWRKDVKRAHSKMKVKFNSWVNTNEQLRYRELCLAFSEVTDMAALIDHEYKDVKNWIDKKFKKLQLRQSRVKAKEIPEAYEIVEGEKTDKGDGWDKILDPISKMRKGRPKKKYIEAYKEAKQEKKDAVQLQNINLLNSQVAVGTSTQESMVSNPYVLQPNMVQPWGMYHPTQFSHEHSLMSQINMSGHLPTMAMPPIYGLQQLLPQQYYGDNRNNMNYPHPGP